ncbi:hypothetical protein [Caballeronia sp. GACF5]|uniref:hypothetical protein n=1 Tax=Caballeronia sp. GACF5 TaxID=2921746 RepID=UPI002028CAE0|nr:hypothetical protein [Caballeronia sp. GACF5]
MAQGSQADDGEFGERDERDRHDARGPAPPHHHEHDDSHRWPAEAPSVGVARVVLKVDGSITLKRAAATAWLTAHHHAAPAMPPRLPIRPTRMELAVVIALAETYGAALYQDARFAPVLDFIADDGAVALVQRVMYGARADSHNSADFDVTARTAENTRLAEVLREARVAFEFLCATSPEVFLAETHALLAGLGVQVRLTDPAPMSPSSSDREDGDEPGRGDDERDEGDEREGDDGEEGGHD